MAGPAPHCAASVASSGQGGGAGGGWEQQAGSGGGLVLRMKTPSPSQVGGASSRTLGTACGPGGTGLALLMNSDSGFRRGHLPSENSAWPTA